MGGLDPFFLNIVYTPVCTSECSLPGNHKGEDRKGHGSDLTGAGVWQREVSPVGGNFGEPFGGGSGSHFISNEEEPLGREVS